MDVKSVRQAAPDIRSLEPIPAQTFDVRAMARLLRPSNMELFQRMAEFVQDDLFVPRYDLSFCDFRELTLQRMKKIASGGFISCFDHIKDPQRFFNSMEILTFIDYSLTIKCGVHYSLAGGAIAMLGTKKHHDLYLPQIDCGQLPGCFGMTELGHGSNVMGIETLATYDYGNRQFIIQTPSDVASKVWIGGAAQHGKICVVFAQLRVGAQMHGVHAFAVRIRDDDGKLVAGVSIQDMGHKMGLNGVDNGRIWFNQLRVQRDALLDRYSKVDESGAYSSSIPSAPQRFAVMVGALSTGRVCIAQSAVDACKLGVTIAARYSCERPQFDDRVIISYLTHQRRLAPALANTYALDLMMLQVKRLIASRKDARWTHALSSGLKAAATWTRVEVLQHCRECCGGMGFLSANQIPSLITDMNVDVTFEGDNTVLMLQVVKATMNRPFDTGEKGHIEAHDFSVSNILELLRVREAKLRQKVTSSDVDRNMDLAVKLGWAFVDAVTLENFALVVSEAPESLRSALADLCDLYALLKLECNAVFYVMEGLMDKAQWEQLRTRINALCAKVCQSDGSQLRRYCDGFGIPEHLIVAPIATGWRNFSTDVHYSRL